MILMLVDDLGYGDVSFFNEYSKIHTPNIDALSECGIAFTDAHSTSALCTPSRYGLLTGRYNWRSRLKSHVLMGDGEPLIEKGRMTMADIFKASDYYTACVGKWHLGMGWQKKLDYDGSEYGAEEEVAAIKAEKADGVQGKAKYHIDMIDVDFSKPVTVGPRSYGFDYFFGLNGSLDQPPYTYIENESVMDVPDHLSGVWPLDRFYPTQPQLWQRGPASRQHDMRKVIPDMQSKVLEIIDSHKDEPFFIYYPTPAVHGPLLPTKEFEGKSGLNAYADMVLMVDHMVGEITKKLKELKIWENTIFVFTSDNGCSGIVDYPFLMEHGHNPSYHFRGKKCDIWEGGHREPTILSWPAKYKSRVVCDEIICLSDFFRTFADINGVKLPDGAGEDSVSLTPILNGSTEPIRDSIIHSSGNGSFSIRKGFLKLELCPDNGMNQPYSIKEQSATEEMPYQLYDLKSDIGEKINIAPQNPDLVFSIKKELLKAIENGRTTPGERQPNTVPEWKQLSELYAGPGC